ncbi:hypothetical protein RHMOL_Rhmol11G0244900 [Rhododendron molle]|uniref:Uncharacterized protein n=1 Tax=Rhododendron molle TaxID=49168 RepID=A0ACC0LW18_RHOML|nr:hypothetical protein RHMOL_Rhmol11G0244900 [Rhododendron molle]
MKQEKVKVVKNKKRLLDLYHHKTKKVAFYGFGQPTSHPKTVDGLYNSVHANPSLMNRVKEVQESLDPKFPIFVKSMNRSAVTVGFMLVYVVRESELGEVDGAVALVHLKGDGRQRNSEIISETMNIANAAKASNLLASRIDFASHIEISKAFEQLQASVGSLQTQMDRLDALALKAKDEVESAKERVRNSGQVHMGERKKALVVKLLKLIEAKVRLGGEIESLKANTSRLD